MGQELDVAIHEVGHILLAHSYGCTIEAVSISKYEGFTKFSAPKSLGVRELVGIGMAGWAAEEAVYYATQYFPLLKIFESLAGLTGVSIFTSIFGRDSRAHHRRLYRMVERARKDIIDMGRLLKIERVERLPEVVFEIARPKYLNILKELDSPMHLLYNREFRRYYERIELTVRTSILERKEAVSRQYFSSKEDLDTVIRLAKMIDKKKHLSSSELAQMLSKYSEVHPGR